MAGSTSKGSEVSLNDEGKRSTKGTETERRVPNLDSEFIITTRVEKGLKRWKFLQTEIPKKQRKVEKGDRSKRLDLYTKERDGLVEQMQKDIPELQSIFYDEYCNAFDRMDKRRTTTGDMRTENHEPFSLRSDESKINQLKSQIEKEGKAKDEALSCLRSAVSEINQWTSQLEKERKSKEETLSRLNRRIDKSEIEKIALKLSHQEEIRVYKEEIRKLQERLTIDKSYEERAKELKRKCDELETELASLEDEERRTEEELKRLTIDKSYVERAKELERKCDELETELASLEDEKRKTVEELKRSENKLKEVEPENQTWKNRLEDEKRRTEEELKRLQAKNNQFTNQLEQERKAKEDALFRLRSAESEINQWMSQLENERKSNEEVRVRLNRQLDESENEKVALKLNHKEEIGVHNKEIRKLQERLTIDKSYEESATALTRKCDEFETELARLQAKNNQFTNQLENERKAKEDALFSLRSAESEINQLKRQLEHERKSKEETLRLEARNNQLTTQLENERKAKEDAILRLSSMASNKLRDNIPNIADLSDPNRPTKISEQFSELYDNEWTDAFDELEKMLRDKEEKEIISYLRDFVLEIYSVCSDLSFSKMKTIEEAFVKPSVPSVNIKIPTEILKTIKDGIKSMAPKLLEDTRGLVLGRLEEKYLKDPVASCLQHKNVKRYIDKCTEVCWYMSVQDPPLVMDGSKSSDDKFDSNKHREYTKKGPYEEFVVWPVLYLYRGGQMLSKGVAQGAKKEMIGQQ